MLSGFVLLREYQINIMNVAREANYIFALEGAIKINTTGVLKKSTKLEKRNMITNFEKLKFFKSNEIKCECDANISLI